jgi:hypothetical protein
MVSESESQPEIILKPLLEYASVQTWMDGLRQHWGGDPETEDPERFLIFEAFCVHVARDPDQIVKETTMLKDGQRRIRIQGRNRYAALIQEWQDAVEGTRFRKAKWGNTVRSFLIHNGVLLQSGVQT